MKSDILMRDTLPLVEEQPSRWTRSRCTRIFRTVCSTTVPATAPKSCHPVEPRMKKPILLLCLALLAGQALAQTRHSFSVKVWNQGTERDETIQVRVEVPANHLPTKPVVLHLSGCTGGWSDGFSEVASQLQQRGIAVADLRSIESRSLHARAVCTTPQVLSGKVRATEAYKAKEELVAMGIGRADNVGIIGYSHGGYTVTHAMFQSTNTGYDNVETLPPFAVGVAVYPWCQLETMEWQLRNPMLMLTGEQDDWTPARRCETLKDLTEKIGKADPSKIELVRYANATHAWDARFPPRSVSTHLGTQSWLQYDADITRQSVSRTLDFLLKHLKLEQDPQESDSEQALLKAQ